VLTLRRIQLAVFMLLDGEGFILQVQRVFTRIRSRAAAVATSGGTLGSTISTEVAVCTGGGFLARSAMNGCKCGG
jgi:predicted PurR-regulated permease PerM